MPSTLRDQPYLHYVLICRYYYSLVQTHIYSAHSQLCASFMQPLDARRGLLDVHLASFREHLASFREQLASFREHLASPWGESGTALLQLQGCRRLSCNATQLGANGCARCWYSLLIFAVTTG
jgi:hypothetical protein